MGRVLITGGSSGLGKALVDLCVERGLAPVCVLDIAPAPDAGDGKLDWVFHDMADQEAAPWAALSETLQKKGPFDLVILNAGINATGRFEGIPLATHLSVARVNLLGPLRLVHMLLHAGLLAPGGGWCLSPRCRYLPAILGRPATQPARTVWPALRARCASRCASPAT